MSETVSAPLLYFTPPKDGSRPFYNLNANEEQGEIARNWTQVPHQIEITNLRGNEGAVTLDTAGFQYYAHESAHKLFNDDEDIKREYYPESEALLKKLTGATRVVMFDHTIRRHRPGVKGNAPDRRQPAASVHVDQTPQSAERRVHMHVPELADELLKHRYQIVNLWRPIFNPAVDFPLGLCDYRSVDKDADLVPSELRYPHRTGETFNVQYNPSHRWYYFRGLKPDEVILIKCFDSKTDVATFTPHSAFVDPTTPKDAPLRESIELRALLFYDNLPNGA